MSTATAEAPAARNPFKVKREAGNFELPPQGPAAGTLVAIVDLGTHAEEDKKTKRSYETHKLQFTFEIEGEDGNQVIAATFNRSFSKKSSLYKFLSGWIGNIDPDAEFDLTTLLGKTGLVNVTYTEPNAEGRQFARIGGVTNLPKGMKAGKPENKPVLWAIGDNIEDLPEWLPYVFGRPVADVIADSIEVCGRGDDGDPR